MIKALKKHKKTQGKFLPSETKNNIETIISKNSTKQIQIYEKIVEKLEKREIQIRINQSNSNSSIRNRINQTKIPQESRKIRWKNKRKTKTTNQLISQSTYNKYIYIYIFKKLMYTIWKWYDVSIVCDMN